jgi:DNA polymerase III epsilon subunit-like protein
MNPYVEKLTGITEAMVADAPVFADVAELDHYLLARQKAVERGE